MFTQQEEGQNICSLRNEIPVKLAVNLNYVAPVKNKDRSCPFLKSDINPPHDTVASRGCD